MAGRGPAPKPDRVRRNADPTPERFVEADGALHGPELCGEGWNEATRQWWETWRRSAQAKDFTETDWCFLLDTAFLHTAFWNGDFKLAAELRLRVAKFGATVEDRARLRIGIGKPPNAGGSEPAKRPEPAEDRDAAILRLVQDAS